MNIKIDFKLVSGIKGFLSPEIDLDALNLYAPVSYWEAAPSEKRKICNGCGTKEGLNVPDTMWGLDISEACKIHDWMYQHGKTLADKIAK